MNPQMFNSFLDGTKSAIEMAAVANACDLRPPDDGLGFPACGVDDLPHILRPKSAGGILEHEGMVEVISSLERDSRPVFRDLRWGVYAVFAAPSDYTKRCFAEYGLKTDSSGCYSSMYKAVSPDWAGVREFLWQVWLCVVSQRDKPLDFEVMWWRSLSVI
jgi:predicted homoserine dehydrogenase-like protein